MKEQHTSWNYSLNLKVQDTQTVITNRRIGMKRRILKCKDRTCACALNLKVQDTQTVITNRRIGMKRRILKCKDRTCACTKESEDLLKLVQGRVSYTSCQ